jgi:cytoskeletal protein CcmA (bactofilin family)
MKIENGKIEGNLRLDYSLKLNGMISGVLTVANGGELDLTGMCSSDLVIEKGGVATIHGMVLGNTVNQGGQLKVYGSINGLITTENGETFVDENAKVNR